ncbi:MAG: nuclear transport factor 2 family protein [Gammaproteobacteria bacterium]|nr:nuclear transport factor 2 family protein [Gammaproteobacteria bacterium]
MPHENPPGAARTVAALTAALLLPGALSSCAWWQRIAGGADGAGGAAAREAANKEVVLRYWRFYNEQDYSVLEETVAEDMAQHSPREADGREALAAAFRELWFPQKPEYYVEIKRMAADGNLVFVHSHVTVAREHRGNDRAQPSVALADIFLLRDGLIAEHWEVAQTVPEEESVNGNTMFDGGGFRETSAAVEEANKAVVVRYMEKFINDKNTDALDELMASDWIAHNPMEPNGREGLKRMARDVWFAQFPEIHAEIKRIGAEGNLVFVHSHYTLKKGDRGNDWAPMSAAAVDIFRLEDGLIVEHWDVVMRGIPAETVSGRSLFDGGGRYWP